LAFNVEILILTPEGRFNVLLAEAVTQTPGCQMLS